MSDSSLDSPLLPQVVDSATKPLTPTVPLWRNLIFTLLQIAMDMIASIPMMLPLFRGVKCTYIPTAFAYMSIFLTLNIFATLLLVYNNLKRAQEGPYRARRDCDNTDVGLVYSGDTFVQISHSISLATMVLVGLIWGGGLTFSYLNLFTKDDIPSCDALVYPMITLSTCIVYWKYALPSTPHRWGYGD